MTGLCTSGLRSPKHFSSFLTLVFCSPSQEVLLPRKALPSYLTSSIKASLTFSVCPSRLRRSKAGLSVFWPKAFSVCLTLKKQNLSTDWQRITLLLYVSFFLLRAVQLTTSGAGNHPLITYQGIIHSLLTVNSSFKIETTSWRFTNFPGPIYFLKSLFMRGGEQVLFLILKYTSGDNVRISLGLGLGGSLWSFAWAHFFAEQCS